MRGTLKNRLYGLICVSWITFLQIYLQICKETTNFADEYGQETDNQTRV